MGNDFSNLNDPQPLGSLAQGAREKEIRNAKICLLIIGVLTVLLNIFMLINLPNEVQQAKNQLGADGKEAETAMYLAGFVIYGGGLFLGGLFILFGFLIRIYPLPIAIVSLVLYIAFQLGLTLLDPHNLYRGIIFKVIVVVILFKAVQAAGAYQKYKNEQAELQRGY